MNLEAVVCYYVARINEWSSILGYVCVCMCVCTCMCACECTCVYIHMDNYHIISVLAINILVF